MPVRNQNWYNLQENRRYPLDDRSTGIDDAGNPIADNIIVDCHIRFPNTLGNFALISAITVSPNIVTVLISAADTEDDTDDFRPIAALTLSKPIETGVNQVVRPLVDGVAGWVAFGSGIKTEFSGRYSSAIQTLIAPRCARPYRPLPIPTVGRQGLATALSGWVRLAAKPPVTATYETIEINETTVPAIVFRLADKFGDRNPLQDFGGPCAARPESGTCAKPGLQTINGVTPDCDGNITIASSTFTILPILDEVGSCGGGIDIITDQGLLDTCTDPNSRRRRRRAQDLCEGSMSSIGVDELPPWSNPLDKIPPEPDIISSISLGDPDFFGVCQPENSCFDFTGADASAVLTVRGLFAFEITDAEDAVGDCAEESVSPRYAYTSAHSADLNISILRNCDAVITTPQTIETVLSVVGGSRRNGGIILNYTPPNFENNASARFVAAQLDLESGALRIVRYNGAAFVVEAQASFDIVPGDWYTLSATIEEDVGGILVSATATALANPLQTATVVTVVSQFGIPTNTIGLVADRAYTQFAKLTFGD